MYRVPAYRIWCIYRRSLRFAFSGDRYAASPTYWAVRNWMREWKNARPRTSFVAYLSNDSDALYVLTDHCDILVSDATQLGTSTRASTMMDLIVPYISMMRD